MINWRLKMLDRLARCGACNPLNHATGTEPGAGACREAPGSVFERATANVRLQGPMDRGAWGSLTQKPKKAEQGG